MDFSFNDDQRAIADMAQSLFADNCSDDHLKAFDASGEPYMSELWGTCVETGLAALYIPESVGGSGLGMTDLMLVLQAQGEVLAPVPLWRHQLATATLAEFAEAGVFSLEGAATGETLLTLSLHEHHDARGIALRGTSHSDGWRLDGRVKAVPLAAQSALALVLAELPEGPRLVVLDPQAQGVQRQEGVMMQGEPVADLVLENVILPTSHVLPEAAIDWLKTRSVAALSALQLGVSEAHLKRTVEYISERRQFDRTIGSFQAVQMSMADAQIALETLRSTLWQLCYRLDAGLPAPAEARAVAYLACEAGHGIGHKAQHVHGGVGVDLSYPIYRYLYWSRALGLELGGASAALDDLGDWLAHNDTLGWKYDLDEYATL
ncbi:acyl-CoA dehydrogenase family protein [Halomonas sp. PR-M31]|uniref:acyl-CoA dehydrogenase family protein n=1 Tax=Halomonas sp. PR-M31 TaxID=1471202 RepID=UPI000650201C|nr:acyl-CoA dehydrogenase family protein [Halomonas sp. PR-M31]